MVLVIYLVIMNLLAFVVYGVDKQKARKHEWRVPEATLILLAVLGGSFGAGLGMLCWHHKTRKPKFTVTVPVFVALWAVFCGFCLYQNYHLTVTEYEAEIGLGHEMTIVQVSDLHNQFFGFGESALLRKIAEEEPDLIVVTGDVLDSFHVSYKIAEDFFAGAVKICPVYYITGNHEVRLDQEKFGEFLDGIREMGVIFLDDAYEDKGEYVLAGIADASLPAFHAYGAFEEEKPVILLAHEPGYVALYQRLRADLVLTGHVHGGQIILPGKGGLLSPEISFFPEYYEGIHDINGMKMVVSRGLGNSVLPVRINNYPEIVVIKVR